MDHPSSPTSVAITREGQVESDEVAFRCMPDGVDLREPVLGSSVMR